MLIRIVHNKAKDADFWDEVKALCIAHERKICLINQRVVVHELFSLLVMSTHEIES